MQNMARTVLEWRGAGRRCALAVVVRTWGSSPREVGAIMAVRDDGTMAGSVSGGCVEGNVLMYALHVIAHGQPCLATFSTKNDKAWEVGAPCGGDIEIAIVPFEDELHTPLIRALAEGHTAELILSLDGMAAAEELLSAAEVGALFDAAEAGGVVPLSFEEGYYLQGRISGEDGMHPFRDAAVVCVGGSATEAHWADPFFIDEAHDALSRLTAPGGVVQVCGAPVFVCRYGARPTVVCVGAVHIAQALCDMAALAGYDTIVVDPRPAFATAERFGSVGKLVCGWPQDVFEQLNIGPNTAVCALTHDPKIDVPALAAACKTQAFYIGCLGHAETLAQRRGALLETGVEQAQLARIYGPIGLWIGGRTPGEIALSALAQIQAARTGRLAHAASMPGHTLADFTEDEMARIAAWRAQQAA